MASCLSARSVLWIATFLGFAINYMVRINVNIAIVSMVKSRGQANASAATICPKEGNETEQSFVKVEGTLDWDEVEQNHILGGYYWLHSILQIPGGLMARKWGAKSVYGLSNLICSLLTIVMPQAANTHHGLLLFLRVLQGFIAGVAWPAAGQMTGVWIPPNERSKFISSFLGSSVGVALTYPMCGLIIDHFGWEYVFYLSGGLGILWYFFWWYFVFDTPSDHPRIDPSERDYIEKSLAASTNSKQMGVPWKAILTSGPVWMVIFVQWGGTWGLFTLLTQAPTFFRQTFGWSTSKTGVLSGIPHLGRALFAILYGVFSDFLLTNGILSRTNVRKMAACLCTMGMGLILTLKTLLPGCDETLSAVLLFSAITIHGAVSSGPLANVVDISPNFAGVIQGLVGTVVSCTGFLSAHVVGVLTKNNQTLDQWNKVFHISSGMLVITGFIYLIWAQAKVQKWNGPKVIDKEMQLLNQEPNKQSG